MITPQFEGQIWTDKDSGILWKAVSLDPPSWVIEARQSIVDWEPLDARAGDQVGFFNENPILGITGVTFKQATSTEGFRLQQWMDTKNMYFPNLVTVHPAGMQIYNCPVLENISLPNFKPVNGTQVIFTGNYLYRACVDSILITCDLSPEFVTGRVDLTGGGSAHPSLSGLTSAKHLILRGVTVAFN